MKEEDLMAAYRNAGLDASRLVRDPAEGVAIAKCLLYRIMSGNRLGKIDGYHPRPCRWCKVDRPNLQAIYDEWMAYSLLEHEDVDLPSPVEAFMRLAPETQAALVRRAQGYEVEDADHLPQSKDDLGQDPERRDIDVDGPVLEQRNQDYRSLTPTWTTGGPPGGVRAPRQQRRRT